MHNIENAEIRHIFCLKIVDKFRNLSGNPAEMVIQAAKEENAAMIVVGSRGIGGRRKSPSESIANYILHHSPVPVVFCHHEHSR